MYRQQKKQVPELQIYERSLFEVLKQNVKHIKIGTSPVSDLFAEMDCCNRNGFA